MERELIGGWTSRCEEYLLENALPDVVGVIERTQLCLCVYCCSGSGDYKKLQGVFSRELFYTFLDCF